MLKVFDKENKQRSLEPSIIVTVLMGLDLIMALSSSPVRQRSAKSLYAGSNPASASSVKRLI